MKNKRKSAKTQGERPAKGAKRTYRDELSERDLGIAEDYAAELSFEGIVAKYGIKKAEEGLEKILNRPKVKRAIQAAKAAAANADDYVKKRLDARAGDIADTILARATDPDDPQQHNIGMWAIDRISPVAQQIDVRKLTLRASPQMLAEFLEAARAFEDRIGGRATPEKAIDIGSTHLHRGSEFIARRDEALALTSTATE